MLQELLFALLLFELIFEMFFFPCMQVCSDFVVLKRFAGQQAGHDGQKELFGEKEELCTKLKTLKRAAIAWVD